MRSYEGVFIFPPEQTPENRKNQFKNLEDLLSKFQGEILHKEEWGKKPLGYPIRKFREGDFAVLEFRMNPGKIGEFRKALQLQEGLLKFMIVVKNPLLEKKLAPKSHEASRGHSSTPLSAQSATS